MHPIEFATQTDLNRIRAAVRDGIIMLVHPEVFEGFTVNGHDVMQYKTLT
jgi:hypothetical protein